MCSLDCRNTQKNQLLRARPRGMGDSLREFREPTEIGLSSTHASMHENKIWNTVPRGHMISM